MDMNRIEEVLAASKLRDLLKKSDEEDCKMCSTIVMVLTIIGAVVAIAGIAYAVYRYLTPDYLDDFDDEDFEDDFDDEFFDDEFSE